MLEADYVYTIFDWQNFVFLMFILLITKVGRFVFRKLYQAHMTHEAVKQSKKNIVVPMMEKAYIQLEMNITNHIFYI